MRKEIIFAISAGIMFGVVIGFGAWRANSTFKNESAKTEVLQDTETQSTNTPTLIPGQGISLLTPETNDVVSENPIQITGISTPNSYIIISFSTKDYVTETDSKGSFSEAVSLDAGINEILITSIDQSGSEVQKEITIVYSSEFNKE